MAEPTVCVIGIGNTLRADDGAGAAAIERLAERFGDDSRCRLIASHQLLPEHAETIGHCSRAIFIDASVELAPGDVRWRSVTSEPATNPTVSQPTGHHLRPDVLLAMAEAFHGQTTEATLCEIGAMTLDFESGLSLPVAEAVDEVVENLTRDLRRWLVTTPT